MASISDKNAGLCRNNTTPPPSRSFGSSRWPESDCLPSPTDQPIIAYIPLPSDSSQIPASIWSIHFSYGEEAPEPLLRAVQEVQEGL